MTIRIIGIHCHDSQNSSLASVPGTEWYHLVNARNSHIGWGAGSRPRPANVYDVPYEDLTDIDWSKYDICIVHSLERYEFLKHVPIKKIYVSHTLPYPLYRGNDKQAVLHDPWVRKMVFQTEEAVLAWRMPPLEVEVISPMIEIDDYPAWTGGGDRILTVCNNMPERNWCVGWDVWRYCTAGLPRVLVGEGNEAAGVDAVGFKDGAAVAEMMRTCPVYFNTNTNSAVGTSLLEAMATGIPIVSVDKWVAHTYFVNSDTHFTPRSILASNVMPQLRAYLKDVLAAPDKYRAMGAEARRVARQVFNPEQFRTAWRALLEEVANG